MAARAEYLYEVRIGENQLVRDSAKDVIKDLLGFRFYTPTHPILDDLSHSSRFELIQSDSVRKWIRYYIQDKERVEVLEAQELNHVQNQMEPFLSQYLDLSKIIYGGMVTDDDLRFLVENKQLGGLLHGRIDKTWSAIYFSNYLDESINKLENALNEELNK